MQIEEFITEKQMLEVEILEFLVEILQEFEEKTGNAPKSINIDCKKELFFGKGKPKNVVVNVKTNFNII